VPDFGYNIQKPDYFQKESKTNGWATLTQILQGDNKYERLSNYIQAKIEYKKVGDDEKARKHK
jgi:hypothetical protein